MICHFCRRVPCTVSLEGGEICQDRKPANDNFKREHRVFIVPPARVLLNQSYYARLAIAVRNLNLPRRKIPDWIADYLYREDVEFFFACGSVYEVDDEEIERAFGGDLYFRWISDFVLSAGTIPKQAPHYTIEARLRILALSFWIYNPDIAKHFAR
jgi:hypothetical protein